MDEQANKPTLFGGAAPESAANPEQFLAELYRELGSQKNDFRNANLLKLIASLVEGETVLDIGCGAGVLLSLLAAQGRDVVGMEPNRAIIDLAAQMHPNLEIHQGLGGDIEQLDRQFDAVTIIDVLEHIEDDSRQLQQIYRVLRPGGQLVVLVPAFQFLYGRRDASNGHFRRYSRKELIEKLNAAGFLLRSSRYWNALGIAPYWVSERLFRRELQCNLRRDQPKGLLKRLVAHCLYAWFEQVENRVSFGCGLSLICIAQKPYAVEQQRRRAA
jgi:2-polyprenyl-3-methyl-5-hydroxy-6-metoxy-1,4-benzoquinol methylase